MRILKWFLFPIILIFWYLISKMIFLFAYNGLLLLYDENIIIILIFLSVYTFIAFTIPYVISMLLGFLIDVMYPNKIIKIIFSFFGVIGFLDAVYVIYLKGKFNLFYSMFLNFDVNIFKNLIFVVLLFSTLIMSLFLTLSPYFIGDKTEKKKQEVSEKEKFPEEEELSEEEQEKINLERLYAYIEAKKQREQEK